jgi:hypothetical protein
VRGELHRIHRQRWRVRVRSSAEAFDARKLLREDFDQIFQRAFVEAFDALVGPEQVLHIERLELELSVRSIAEVAAVLPEVVRREVTRLVAQLSAFERSSSAPPRQQLADGVRLTDVISSRREALRTYLRTGNVAWFDAAGQGDGPKDWLVSMPDQEIATLLAVPDLTSPAVTFRLLQLLPESSWRPLLRAFVARACGARGAPPAIAVPEGTSSTLADTLLATLDDVVASPALTRYPRLRLIAALVAAWARGAALSRGEILAELAGSGVAETSLLHQLPARLHDGFDAGGTANRARTAIPERSATFSASPAAPLATAGSARAQASEPSSIVAHHAGLVLLQPFLRRLLERSGLCAVGVGPAALEPSALPRAAALLSYVATGEHELPEHELSLVKALLGMALDDPLQIAAGLLSASECEQADALLHAVIDHWSALKKTSVNGLRASFLMRRGLLRELPQGLELRVEPTGYDLLLKQLPWGMSLVKLPWMQRPIFVEWPTA